MPQTSVTLKPAAYVLGMLLDCSFKRIDSRVSTEASLEINPGTPVKPDGAEGALGCRADSDVIFGIALWMPGADWASFSAAGGYKPKIQLDIMRQGRTVVELDTGISAAAGDRLFYNTSTGKWRKAAVMGATIDAQKQVQCTGVSTAAGGLVPVEVDFLNVP